MHRLVLFGGAFLEGPDGPLTGRAAQGHRLALLALLAAEHPRPLTRDRLIAYLWPESDSERGRRLLRHALHLLRAALGKDAVQSHGDELRLDPARLGCDLWEFREAIERRDLEAALTAYGGPFLDGVYLDEAGEFERWVEVERSRLASCFAEALAALAEQHEAAGGLRGAAGAWRRLSEQDPYNSHYALRLMQALAAIGDRAGALRHAAEHTALLQADFGAEPDADVEALAARLREEPGPRAAQPTSRCATIPAGEATRAGIPPAEGSDALSAAPQETPVPGAPVAQPDAPPGADEAMPRLWRRSAQPRARALVLGSMLALGLFGMLTTGRHGEHALALLGFGSTESLLRRGVLAERERILLADFTSPTGDTLLAGMATEAFRIDLAQSPILTLVEPQQVRAALGRMERSDTRFLDPPLAQELAVREGLKAVLVGEIVRSGSAYLLSARLVAPESGEILAAHRETARDSTALLPALDRLSKQLRRRIGEPLRSVRADPPLAQVTTSSLEALRKYSQAVHALNVEGDRVKGAVLLEEAVALDSAFAMAYRRLGMLLGTRSESRTRQVEALTRAYTNRSRLPEHERYLALASYYSHVTGEREKAITAYQSLLDSDSNHPRALADLAFQYSFLHEWTRVEEYALRSWQLDSTAFYPLWLQMVAQFHQRRYGDADATLLRLTARFPGNWLIGFAALSMAAARGDYAGAAAYAQAERQARPEDLAWQTRMTWQLACLAAVAGRLAEMERYLLELGELDRRRDTPGEHLSNVLVLARLEMTLGGAPEKALGRVRQALAETPLSELPLYDRPYTALAEIHARAGQPARAREILAEWEGLGPVVILREDQPTMHGVRGEIALATGRPWDALREFRVPELRIGTAFALVSRGRAYDQAGQPDSALAFYERFLAAPDIFRLEADAEWRGPILERLGQLYDARGDRGKAAEHYRSFIELWRDADPELQPRVREARRRLAALSDEG